MSNTGAAKNQAEKENIPDPKYKELDPGAKKEFVLNFNQAKKQGFNVDSDTAKKLYKDAKQIILEADKVKKLDHLDGWTLKALQVLQEDKIMGHLTSQQRKQIARAQGVVEDMFNKNIPDPKYNQLNTGKKTDFVVSFNQAKKQSFNIGSDAAKDLYKNAKQIILEAAHDKKLNYLNGLTLKALRVLQEDKIMRHLTYLQRKKIARAQGVVEKMRKDSDNDLMKRAKESAPKNSTFMPQPGAESYGDRIAQLAKFDPNSMAFMALTDEVIFLGDLVLSLIGAKLLFSQAGEFSELKKYRPHLAYDPADYPYPEGDSQEAINTREATKQALAERQIYDYSLHNGMLDLNKEGGAITDPTKITYEIAAANGLIHKPDNVLAARHSVIDFWTKVVGKAPDQLFWIMRAQERDQQKNSPSQQNNVRDAAQLAAMNRPTPTAVRVK